jgi:hypothetical protein
VTLRTDKEAAIASKVCMNNVEELMRAINYFLGFHLFND